MTEDAGTPPGGNRALALLRRITHLGVDPLLPRQATKHIVLTNQYALFTLSVFLASAVGPVAHTLLPEVRVWLGAGALASLIVPVVNALRWPTTASATMLVADLVVFLAVGRLEPADAEHFGLFMVTAAVSWFVFPRARRLAAILVSSGAAAATFALTWSFLHSPPPPQLPGYDGQAIALGNLLITLSTLVFFCARAAHEISRVERELVAERARSESFLKKEVAHQVAERSREMGAALSRSDGSLTHQSHRSHVGAARFGPRYRVVRPLGEGGMGAVFEVERATDSLHLALKVMTGHVSRDQAGRFAREAEIGARLHHENLVSIIDVGVADGGSPFLVMELVTGGSLESLRARFGDVAWAMPILRQVTAGLVALHDAGVVHRDLKPANVLLDGVGIAKLADFGIARFGPIPMGAVDPDAPTDAASPRGSKITGTGAWVGTPMYMAPEAARDAREVGTAVDVFAFGIVAFELLTNRPPFATPPMLLALVGQVFSEAPALDVAGLSATVREAIVACLAEDPARRPSARQLQDALND